MQVTSAIDIPEKPVVHSGRSSARAAKDIRDGIAARELWGHLGWQDIKQRYRRSVIGPLWITMSMGVTAAGLGFLYSQLFGIEVDTFLPYLTVGFIVWGFILGCLTEGSDAFISNEGLIKHLPAPLTVYALRTVWRQTLMLLHNMLVYVVVLVLFFGSISKSGYVLSPGGVGQPGLSWTVLLAIPAFVALALNGAWVTLLFGIISTRYRDIPQVINALTQLLFYATPIVWPVDILTQKLGPGDWKHLIVELNPLYHFIQVLRAPLIGSEQSWHHWVVVGVITVVGWTLAFAAMRNYRSRVSYWV
ncbi:ABC-2 type transport system permease protein [Actinokineospora terrae]|uniref:ABC-2 type transport system permease protein n=1 Tax=Actinokineospora terrae TaxID=155974 RepID=A0A1H9XLH4_9PSEU|nr:ABC transporter permease [Actinokineospora terrae]SES46513.1 ABC-2 type transport system permease protein [Actinokineospora terrae]